MARATVNMPAIGMAVAAAFGAALQSPERTVVNLSDVGPQPDPPVDTIVIALLVLIAVATAAFLYVKLRKRR